MPQNAVKATARIICSRNLYFIRKNNQLWNHFEQKWEDREKASLNGHYPYSFLYEEAALMESQKNGVEL